MNRYPLWKYILIAVALTLGLLYTLPNFYGEAPAVQVSSIKTAVKVDVKLLGRVWNLRFAPNLANRGDCDPPDVPKKEIRVLSTLTGEERLEVLVHEMVHAM